jgi:hypothetical protein
MTQYGLHYFTEWKLPIKVGAALHYEKSEYKLSGAGSISYSSFSFGPQFKTKDFEILSTEFRLQTQIRVSPFAAAHADTVNGREKYKFNTADLMTSIEHPWKNQWGEFVVGLFYQIQWLNLKDSSDVNIESSNKTNTSLGLSLSQVIQ